MSNDIDPERVGRAAAEVADVDFRAMGEKDAILAELTDAERRVVAKASALIAVSMLRDVDVLKDPPRSWMRPTASFGPSRRCGAC